MGLIRVLVLIVATFPVLISGGFVFAQGEAPISPQPASMAAIPRLIRIHGTVRDVTGKPLTTRLPITFTLYREENSQDVIWQEVQNVQPDSTGRYSVLLGAATERVYRSKFSPPRRVGWASVQRGRPSSLGSFLERALCAEGGRHRDAGRQTCLGLRLAGSQSALPNHPRTPARLREFSVCLTRIITRFRCRAAIVLPIHNQRWNRYRQSLTKFTTACNIENSAIFESGGNVGIGNTSPAAMLDVSGPAIFRSELDALGGLVMPPVSTATAAKGFASTPADLEASVFNSASSQAVTYLFRWQATPVGNNTANTGATLNLLYGLPGLVNPTGLSVDGNGILTFASGQTFPGAGTGTVTSVGTGAGLTGGPITKTGTISPAAGVTNSMLANPSVTVQAGSGLSGGGTVALGGTITLTNSAPSSGGTVTSVETGAGLTGGPITKTGTISIPAAGVTNSMLANPSVTVQAGSGLSGGGTVALGGTVTPAICREQRMESLIPRIPQV